MHSFAPFSNLNFFVKNRQNVFAIELMNFINSIAKNSNFAFFFCEFLMNFFRISRQILENSEVCRFFNQICENKSEICRKFWILWKLLTIVQNHSLVSLVAPHADGDRAGGHEEHHEGQPDAVEDARLRSEVNNSLIIVNFFHKIQNFRQISDLFSQIWLKKRHTSLFSGIWREIRKKIHQKFAEKMQNSKCLRLN